MFIVSDAEAASIRQAYLEHGEEGAVLELRRLFAGLEDNEGTRMSAVTIAGWISGAAPTDRPPQAPPAPAGRLPRADRHGKPRRPARPAV